MMALEEPSTNGADHLPKLGLEKSLFLEVLGIRSRPPENRIFSADPLHAPLGKLIVAPRWGFGPSQHITQGGVRSSLCPGLASRRPLASSRSRSRTRGINRFSTISGILVEAKIAFLFRRGCPPMMRWEVGPYFRQMLYPHRRGGVQLPALSFPKKTPLPSLSPKKKRRPPQHR
jgi:hypothetical protein